MIPIQRSKLVWDFLSAKASLSRMLDEGDQVSRVRLLTAVQPQVGRGSLRFLCPLWEHIPTLTPFVMQSLSGSVLSDAIHMNGNVEVKGTPLGIMPFLQC